MNGFKWMNYFLGAQQFYCAKFILFNVFALKRDKRCYPEFSVGIWVHVVLKHGPCRAKHNTWKKKLIIKTSSYVKPEFPLFVYMRAWKQKAIIRIKLGWIWINLKKDLPPGEGGGVRGVWGLKFVTLRFFGVGKVDKYFFGWFDFSANFSGIQKNLKICGSVCVSWLHSSANKVQPNLFCGCLTSFGLWPTTKSFIFSFLFHKCRISREFCHLFTRSWHNSHKF